MQVADALPGFADAFPFDEFNEMQREALPILLETDDNVVASAPTASGKTALAELAICRTLERGGTALFIAPLRALTNEKEADWDRFESLGYDVYVVTGERELDPGRAERADILVMTPEKTDSATRKADSARYAFIRAIDCVIIDEVHLLDAERRGAVLEVTISRLRRRWSPRIVALSATMQNVEDVARWLDAPARATFDFGEGHRPVTLHADVETYSHGENPFADKYRRLYRALDLAEPHIRDGGQALVFVASRRDTVRAAEKARDELAERDVPVGVRGEYEFHTETQALENDTLRQSALDGVGFHHAGLSKSDRDRIEEWFREGRILLLFSTSTLAWGVNLPARCVIIRDTKLHDPLEGEVPMSPMDVLQMIGRAGRPGYDDVGYGWVICDQSAADRYRRLLRRGSAIESRLADSIEDHLVAEVAIGTIESVADAMAWVETTFYAARAAGGDDAASLATIRRQVETAIDALEDRGFLDRDPGGVLGPTTLGALATDFYLRLPTAERFAALLEGSAPTVDEILIAVAAAAEFDRVSARQSERDAIEATLSGVSTGQLDRGGRKVLAILRSAMRGTTPAELRSDAWIITHNATRLLAALHAFCTRFDAPRTANRVRRIEARIEHGVSGDAVDVTAIEGVGAGRATKLARSGIATPAAVVDRGVDGLVECGFGRSVAEQLVANARDLPAIDVAWGEFPSAIAPGDNEIHEVTVRSTGGRSRAHVRVTVNGVTMVEREGALGTMTVPVGIFGAETDRLRFEVEVTVPEHPLSPTVETRTVRVERP